ncbi:hypothetical protein NE865_08146 [Phthorimaea operculella]|nr:hypothetical protein NE865_08146 [Phthorimaea operculella]
MEEAIQDQTIDVKPKVSRRKYLRNGCILLFAIALGYLHYRYVLQLHENYYHFSHLSDLERELTLRTEMGFYYSYYKTVVEHHTNIINLYIYHAKSSAKHKLPYLNWKHFSHLSDLERELTLRTEMGFYYSYYKTVVEERPFLAAITRLMYDRQVEYPKEVNAFNRFNIHPEVIIGALYRYAEPYINTSSHKECHLVHRGEALPPVHSCSGIGVPMMFYLEAVWILAGLLLTVVFLQGATLSGTVLGGVLSVAQYLANHAQATRVQRMPNERENLAVPLLFLQVWLLTVQLRYKEKKTCFQLQVSIFIINCLCLLFWQLSQFIFLTQTAIFFVMEQLKIIDLKTLCVFLHSHFCGGIENNTEDKSKPKIVDLNKLSKEFQAHEEAKERIDSIFVYFMKTLHIDPAVFYNVSQTVVFGVMAYLFMRLKILLTTQMCVVASLAVNTNMTFSYQPRLAKLVFWGLAVSVIAQELYGSITRELAIQGEFSDYETEELIEWITRETPAGAAFAGSMPVSAAVMLSARRAVVSHPHYEHAEARDRAYAVHKVYGRFTAQQLYEELTKLKATYLIVENGLCYGRTTQGCTILDVWDAEKPSYKHKPQLCHTILTEPTEHLYRVFANKHYSVFRVHDLSVRYMPRVFDT